jgi:rhodanese-related sulfurtransferase
MRRSVQRALVIVFGSAALGLAVNAISPRRIPYITPPKPVLQNKDVISLDEAHRLWGRGTSFFLDARAPADYASGHIANAFNLPAEAFDEHFPAVASMLTADSSIIVYCDGTECELSHRCADLLRQRGYKDVRVLVNGWTVWHMAGYPTSTSAQP